MTEVYQVIMTTDIVNYGDRDQDYSGETDMGLFASLYAADQFIEKWAKDNLEAAIDDGDGAWISAYPKDSDLEHRVKCLRKSIMMYQRKTGNYVRLDFDVVKRIVQESA